VVELEAATEVATGSGKAKDDGGQGRLLTELTTKDKSNSKKASEIFPWDCISQTY
jgi:hypothetical protein